jgi:transposase
MRCSAQTAAGSPCRGVAMRGGERCHAHSGGPVGRREKLSEELQKKICDAVAAGNRLAAAAEFAGVSRASAYRWRKLGEERADARYVAFAEAVRQAEARGEVHAVGIVRRELPNDVRAAQWLLERRYGWRRPSPEREPAQPAQARPPDDDPDTTDDETRTLLSALLAKRPADRAR